jgi:hypothetical protein
LPFKVATPAFVPAFRKDARNNAVIQGSALNAYGRHRPVASKLSIEVHFKLPFDDLKLR